MMKRYGFHIIISIQASDAQIMNTRAGARDVDRSIVKRVNLFKASQQKLEN